MAKNKVKKKLKGTLYQRGKIWWLEYYVDGARVRKSLDTESKPEAVRLQEEETSRFNVRTKALKRQAVADALELEQNESKKFELEEEKEAERRFEESRKKLTVKDSWQVFINCLNRPDCGSATLRQYSFQWDAFVNWLTENHEKINYLEDIIPAIANGYIRHLQDKSFASGTINKHKRLCNLVFNTLIEDDEIDIRLDVSPFSKIKSKTDKQNRRKEIPWDKLCEICDATDGEMKTLLFLGIYTGLRLGDCCLLTWDCIDLKQGYIFVEPSKTAKDNDEPLHIAISPHLRPLLEEVPVNERIVYLLPEIAELYKKNIDNVTDRVQALFKKCGLELYKEGTGPGTEKRAVLQYGFHSLRHTTATLFRESGVPQSVCQSILGHKSTAMLKKYTHVGRDSISNAINKLPPLKPVKSIPEKENGSPVHSAIELLKTQNADNWQEVRDQVVATLSG